MNKGVTVLQDFASEVSLIIKENNVNTKSLKKNKKFLIHLIDKIPDYRVKYLIKYRLSDLIIASLILIIKQEFKSFYFASEFIKAEPEEFLEFGLFQNGNFPSHDTFRRMFMLLDADKLKEAIINSLDDFMSKMLKNSKKSGKKELLSIDGKEFRGSGRSKDTFKPLRNTNVLNAYSVSKNLCLESIPLDSKEGEIIAAQNLLSKLNLKACIVTGDALHCQKNTCSIITENKGDYVFTVKGNQDSLYEEIETKLSKDSSKLQTINFNNCVYSILKLKSSYIGCEFPKQKTYIKMVSNKRSKQSKDKTTTRLFISSLNDESEIIQAIDNRWKIENDLHNAKDTYYNEDDYLFTDKNAIKVMASLNNIALAFNRTISSLNPDMSPTRVMIKFRMHPIETLELISTLLDKKTFSKILKTKLNGIKK